MAELAPAPFAIGGVQVKSGSTVVVSPYLTHRMDRLWDRPNAFDPRRFESGGEEPRHRFAYFPFGAGPHQCLGQHLFMIEANAVGRDFDIKETDLTNQRLLSFVFTPGADDLHTYSPRAKLMPNVLMNNTRKSFT